MYSTVVCLVLSIGYISLGIWNTASYRRQLNHLVRSKSFPISYESSDDVFSVRLGEDVDSNRRILQELRPPPFLMESFYCTIVLEVSDETAVPMEYLNTVVKVDYLNDPLSTNELKRALRYFPKCKRFLFPRVEITDAVVAELESIETPLTIDICDRSLDDVSYRKYGKHTIFWLFSGSPQKN